MKYLNSDIMDTLKNALRVAVGFMLMMLTSLTCGCSSDEPVPEPDEPPTEVNRAVLVYMVANNSLGSSAVSGESQRGFDNADLREMREGAANGALGRNRLIVYHHAYGQAPQLIEITADGDKVLKDYDTEENSVSVARMERVIADFKELAPASAYGIILWSHADGWLNNGIDETASPSGIALKAFGNDGSQHMKITTLANVLDGKGFDYVYFDCCYMGGVEVMYQLRNVTPVIVASVSELRSPGMPYDLTLPYLMADNADVAMAASTTFNYYDVMSGWYRTCTMSVISTEKLDDLAEAVGALYDLHPQLPETYVGQRFAATKKYYYDLRDYLNAFVENDPFDGTVLAAYERADKAIDDVVLYQNATPYLWQGASDQVTIKSHCGLSTYILPNASDSTYNNYNQLDWWKDVACRLWN